ncbi:MAG: NAD-dependent DNA ligase LigA [Eubacterium sp.]
MRELVEILNKAARTYYQESHEIMSNLEYDRLYDELLSLEKETGIVLANSPTVNVGYEVVSELPKEKHDKPMLSLDKTKEISGLKAFLGNKKGLLSWKLDGLTVVLTYNKGSLIKAVTRGNGTVGEVITNNARVFKNVPVSIEFKGELVVRGEAVIKYSDFEMINASIEDVDARYKNPRNLCSGSVRQLNNEITAQRNVNFYAFALIKAEETVFDNSVQKQFEWLKSQGFDVVEHKVVTQDSVDDVVKYFADKIADYDIPSDGLVMVFDDIQYGLSLGTTAKFPKNGLAFKWADEQAQTRLLDIEWSPSRTGLINPVAIFEPVELEGTTVSRASVHNISIMENLELGVGDTITVYKANMIIPQIADNFTRSGVKDIPDKCPACGGPTKIQSMNDAKSLYCINPDCVAKHVKLFTHFVARDAMNIDGLSEETLQKFIDKGFIHEFADIFKLSRYEEKIVSEKGFGRKSYENLVNAINNARNVSLPSLIYSLGIPNIGLSNAKMICKNIGYDIDVLRTATREKLADIEGVGLVIADTFVKYFENDANNVKLDNLLKEVNIISQEVNNKEQIFEGKTFVITGSVEHFSNRKELKEFIEERGGKVTGSVTGNTDYLINNDLTSVSGKNKKAKELGISVISEEEFLALANA